MQVYFVLIILLHASSNKGYINIHAHGMWIFRFHQVLKALADTEEAQIVMLKAIHELWHTHQQVK